MDEMVNNFSVFMKVERNYSPHTISSYISDVKDYIASEKIDSPDGITKQSIRSFIAKLIKLGKTPETRNHKLAAIRAFCKFIWDEHLINRSNPALEIHAAKTERKLPEIASQQKIDEIASLSEINSRDKAMIEILYGCGLRVSELVSIRVTDIQVDTMNIRVLGKGTKERMVPLTSHAMLAIEKYTKEFNITDGYLFPSTRSGGGHITDRAVRDMVAKYGKEAGVKMYPHKFRHSVATHLLTNGMDTRMIQAFLGHENINTTTIYAKVETDSLAKSFRSAHPRC